MRRFLCIHGHFYQPPREDPWTGAVAADDAAAPFRDWNERITAECYAPNSAARILDRAGRIRRVANNYAQISCDFGPTLLAWLARRRPEVHAAVLEGDRRSRERFSGHGSALAQPYNHMILPLANRRDKQTQVIWGLRDFAHRFGRPAEGVWLPEAAVDLESLELLAERGVCFTLLAPHQARRVRRLDGRGGATAGPGAGLGGPAAPWQEVAEGRIDCTVPYLLKLPSGKSTVVFFYDGPISRAVAFERLLASGERFAERLLSAFPPGSSVSGLSGAGGTAGNGAPGARGAGADEEGAGLPDRLVHIATDGETYGHHHRHGEMALAYALHLIEEHGLATLTNYGEHLASHPPRHEVEIHENTSWSCLHGIDRWRDDCGCQTGGLPGWRQGWRAPLRDAFDHLRDELAPRFEDAAAELFADPWAARDDFIEVLLASSGAGICSGALSGSARLEGPCASRGAVATHLADPDAAVEDFLDRHKVGAPLAGSRRRRALALLEMQRHAMLMYTSCGWFFHDLGGIETRQVLGHAARAARLAESLCGGGLETELLRRLAWAKSNDPALGTGRDLYLEQVQRSTAEVHRLRALVVALGGDSGDGGDGGGSETAGDAAPVGEWPGTHDLEAALLPAGGAAEEALRQLVWPRLPLLRALRGLGARLPLALRGAAQAALACQLEQLLADPAACPGAARQTIHDAEELGLALDRHALGPLFEESLCRLLLSLCEPPACQAGAAAEILGRAAGWLALARDASFDFDPWRLQNLCCELRDTLYPRLLAGSSPPGGAPGGTPGGGPPPSGDLASAAEHLRSLASALGVALDPK